MTTAPITIDPPFLLLNSAAMIQLILLHLGWLHFSTKYSFWAALSRWWRRRIVILSPLSRTFTFAFQENIHLEPQLLPDCDSISTLLKRTCALCTWQHSQIAGCFHSRKKVNIMTAFSFFYYFLKIPLWTFFKVGKPNTLTFGDWCARYIVKALVNFHQIFPLELALRWLC